MTNEKEMRFTALAMQLVRTEEELAEFKALIEEKEEERKQAHKAEISISTFNEKSENKVKLFRTQVEVNENEVNIPLMTASYKGSFSSFMLENSEKSVTDIANLLGAGVVTQWNEVRATYNTFVLNVVSDYISLLFEENALQKDTVNGVTTWFIKRDTKAFEKAALIHDNFYQDAKKEGKVFHTGKEITGFIRDMLKAAKESEKAQSAPTKEALYEKELAATIDTMKAVLGKDKLTNNETAKCEKAARAKVYGEVSQDGEVQQG